MTAPGGLWELARKLATRASVHRGELLLIGLGHVFALVGNFAGVKLLTHFLAPAAYGELALGMTAAGVLFSLGYSPLGSAMMRFYSISAGKGELAVHVSAFGRAARLLTLAVVLVAAACSAIVAVLTNAAWGVLLAGGALYAIGNGLSLLQTTYSTAIRRRGSIVLYQLIDTWARPLCALAALFLFGRRGAIALGGYVVAGAINASFQWLRARSTPAIRESRGATPSSESQRKLLAETVTYALPLALTALFTSVSNYGDRWTLQGLLGPAELGLYAALCQVGTVPSSLVGSMIGAFIYPICFERAGSLETRAQLTSSLRILRWATLATALLAIPVVAVAMLCGPLIMDLLTAHSYAANAGLLWVVVLAGFVLTIGRTAILALEILRETRSQLLPWIINAALTVALSLALGARWGVRGIIAALFLSNLCGAIACIWISWRLVRIRLAALPT